MGIKRFHLGYIHPNVGAAAVIGILLSWVWINFERIRQKNVLLIFCIVIVLYILTHSRASFLCGSLLCLLLLIKNNEKSGLRKLAIKVSPYVVPFCAVLTIILIYHYKKDNTIVSAFDRILTGRIKLGAYGLQNEGITIIGHYIPYLNGRIPWDPYWGLNGFTFDNVYSQALIHSGAIWLMIYAVVFYLLGKKQNFKISSYIIIWAFYGLTEIHGLNGFIWMPIFIVIFLFKPINGVYEIFDS